MQLTKVVITSALVIAACAEGLPDSKGCALKLPPNRATLAQWEVVYSMDISKLRAILGQ